jgi:hypothetical protein
MSTYTTKSILDDTKIRPPPDLFFEQIIKTLSEPLIWLHLKTLNDLFKKNHDGWFAVCRGGDALNYYYQYDKYIPTHDFDIGICNVTKNQISMAEFKKMKSIIASFCTNLTIALNDFFRTTVRQFDTTIININNHDIISKRNAINFTYNSFGPNFRHDSIFYNEESPIIDFIITNFVDKDDGGNQLIPKFFENKPKWTIETLNNLYIKMKNEFPLESNINIQKRVITHIQDLIKGDRGSRRYPENLYSTSIELIIQDTTSKMYYIAPGDLLTDTMNMIRISSFELPHTPVRLQNNKILKYLAKYATLLDSINNFNQLCPNNSCTEINRYIISRDTIKYKCGRIKRQMILDMINFFYDSLFFATLSQNRWCQIYTILSFIANK